MITSILILALLNAFEIIGIFEASKFGKVLYLPSRWTEKNLPHFLHTPLWGCIGCMASLHGSIVFLAYFGFSFWLFFYIPCVSGLTLFAYELFLWIRKNRNQYEKA